MKSLYLRIYATVVLVLLLFALVSGWILQRHLDQERLRNESIVNDRMGAWAELLQRALPGADAAPEVQAAALRDWSQRLRVPLALDRADGSRIGASDSFLRRSDGGGARSFSSRLDDGRILSSMRPGAGRQGGAGALAGERSGRWSAPSTWLMFLPGVPRGFSLALVLVVLFIAVAAGAYPVVRRLTRRLETLKRGVEQFGAGELGHRVAISGDDEVAAVAASFNVAAGRVESLVQAHRSLLANASHELRSPLARMKMAVSMIDDAAPEQRGELKREIDRNVGELDALVEEVLLASRLDGAAEPLHRDAVDLLAVAAEESARVEATLEAPPKVIVAGDERLLRRAVRNLLENARRHGGGEIDCGLTVANGADGAAVSMRVDDRGPGVPEAMRERIFEPFFRLAGHAEASGGVGLGLALVKQIATRHGGSVRCESRAGGGSSFVLDLPPSR